VAPVLPSGHTAGDFYRQFDGLGYEEILSLADTRIVRQYSAYLMRRSREQMERSSRLAERTKPYFPPPPPRENFPTVSSDAR
jgi:hypothetical protein